MQEEKTYQAWCKVGLHRHPDGRVLLITEDAGYDQERGKPARVVRKGDVIKVLRESSVAYCGGRE